MPKFIKKPVAIEATQWFKNGDHPQDGDCRFTEGKFKGERFEGKVVRYFRNPKVLGEKYCDKCGHTMHEHGWIDTLEGGHIVCVGDYIITGVKGENYPCKPDIFKATYYTEDEYAKLVYNTDINELSSLCKKSGRGLSQD